MANCIIKIKGENTVLHFIKDCTSSPDGKNYFGKGKKILGLKQHLFDVIWTEEEWEDGQEIDREISPALLYHGRVVSNRWDVDRVTQELIGEKYSDSDEKKYLRLAVMNDRNSCQKYLNDVSDIVEAGKLFKDKHFPKE